MLSGRPGSLRKGPRAPSRHSRPTRTENSEQSRRHSQADAGFRFNLAIAANSGWYTLPDLGKRFPYGLAGSPYPIEKLESALSRPLVVFLGTEDSPDQGGFRTRSEAIQQGATRQQRGIHFYENAKRLASTRGVPFGWELEYAKGIGHDFTGMAEASISLLLENTLITELP